MCGTKEIISEKRQRGTDQTVPEWRQRRNQLNIKLFKNVKK